MSLATGTLTLLPCETDSLDVIGYLDLRPAVPVFIVRLSTLDDRGLQNCWLAVFNWEIQGGVEVFPNQIFLSSFFTY